MKKVREDNSPWSIIRNTASGPCPFSQNSRDFSCVDPPANMEDLQDTCITNANLLLPVPLFTLRTSTATSYPQNSTEWRSCSLQSTALDFATFPAHSILACTSLPAFSSCPNIDISDQLFSLHKETGEKERLPQ